LNQKITISSEILTISNNRTPTSKLSPLSEDGISHLLISEKLLPPKLTDSHSLELLSLSLMNIKWMVLISIGNTHALNPEQITSKSPMKCSTKLMMLVVIAHPDNSKKESALENVMMETTYLLSSENSKRLPPICIFPLPQVPTLLLSKEDTKLPKWINMLITGT